MGRYPTSLPLYEPANIWSHFEIRRNHHSLRSLAFLADANSVFVGEKSRMWRSFQIAFDEVNEESRQYQQQHQDWDLKVMAILIITAVVLTLQEYVFDPDGWAWLVTRADALPATRPIRGFLHWTIQTENKSLAGLLYWAFGTWLTYVFIPVVCIKCVFRESLQAYGLRFRGCWQGWWLYLGMFIVMLPPVIYFAQTERFQQSYPFYEPPRYLGLWPRFWIWELCYCLQFVWLEFFFRGFLVHGLKHRFGVYSVFVMMVPYCMIHYHKPLPETFGAIGAGIILGAMSLKTRSIWLGAALHIGVALSMDFLALYHLGLLRL